MRKPCKSQHDSGFEGDEIAYIGKTSLKEISIREDDTIDATGKFKWPLGCSCAFNFYS